MSPEQIRAESIDFRSDVYSVGCVLYETLTGQPPFVSTAASDDSARAAVLAAHLGDRPVPPRRREPSIPPHVNRLILQALEKDPARRVAGCAEFARLLDASGKSEGRKARLLPAASIVIAALVVLVLITLIAT